MKQHTLRTTLILCLTLLALLRAQAPAIADDGPAAPGGPDTLSPRVFLPIDGLCLLKQECGLLSQAIAQAGGPGHRLPPRGSAEHGGGL